ncbi:hypothetical protein JOD43_000144 [Pullulanibacillus pueri]|nr:hypothetical protein [Pullulanibacillus pueri]
MNLNSSISIEVEMGMLFYYKSQKIDLAFYAKMKLQMGI